MLGGIEHWKLASPMDVNLVIQQLQNNPNIEYVEPNHPRYLRLMPNETNFNLQWAMHNTGQFIGSIAGMDINLPTAWDITTGNSNVIVAVIDDAIDINHPDLKANIWTNLGEIAGNNIDDDNNGYVDDIHGWDFVDNDNDPSADVGTGEGHGTMVAGCIGAVGNNGLGIAGVNWNVSIMPLKFLGDVASELKAMDYAIANGAKIINASWGGPQFSFAESASMKKLLQNGILLVAAAGNYEGNNDRVLDYPSSLPYANIIAVSAYRPDGNLTAWTHYGATSVDIAAPGQSIYTTTTPNLYDYVSGTSFSAPLTAGLAGLILAQYPNATYQEIKGRLMGSAKVMSQHAQSATDGSLNAAQALSMNAQPVLVISKLQLSDNNNNLIDPNESIKLDITLENVWQAATTITASLSSSHPLLSISPASSSWIDLAMGQKAVSITPFTLQTGSLVGFQNIPFTLTITINNGTTFTRYFNLDSGTLITDTVYSGQTMQYEQDEFQYFHIDVAAGSPLLNITTASHADIDILLRFNAEPEFDYSLYAINPVFGHDSATHVSSLDQTGNEQILINNPQAGTWHVVVVSYDQQPGSYQILGSTTTAKALVPLPQASSKSSGLCLAPTSLLASSGLFFWLCLFILYHRKTYHIQRESS